MRGSRVGLELRARGGRVVLVFWGSADEVRPEDLRLPDGLAADLHEWARVAGTVPRAGAVDGEAGTLVSRRGRQLADRLAAGTGAPVGYADPVRGGVEVLLPREPTPWATGLAVSTVTAVLAAVTVFALSIGLAGVSRWLAVLGNLLMAAGLAPSLWFARSLPVWRWVAFGVAAGVPLAWVALLLGTLD